MTSGAPRVLFVPVSGAGGAGEFMRSLIIARGVCKRWPEARVHFVINREAAYADRLEFPQTAIQGSPTYNVAAVNAAIERERPHVVVFDSSGRVAQYRKARQMGAAVVYVSSRFKTRWKGFRLRRMRYFDQHWIAQPRFLGSELTRWERLKLRLVGRVEPVFLDVLFEPPEVSRRERLLASLDVSRDGYIALCIGSGGRYAAVSDAAATLVAAAERIHRATELTCVVITGPNARVVSEPTEGVRTIASLPNGELMDLLTGAKAAVVNGGSLLLQAIANGVPAIAVPVAGDQAERIRRCAELGLVVSSELDAAAMERDFVALVTDTNRVRVAMDKLALNNGASVAIDALGRLLKK